MDSASLEAYALLEPCEVLTEEEWVKGGLTPWVEEVGEEEVGKWKLEWYTWMELKRRRR